jgi:hypothetical protein
MTVLAESVLAYTSSLGGIGLLWYLSARNRAAGWSRRRHPNCYEPLPVVLESERFETGRSKPLIDSGTAQQLVALSQSVLSRRHPDVHQKRECPEVASTSRT